jgi:hypothetical protein
MGKAGGVDNQPAERLTWMLFAERVRLLFEKQALSENWAADMTASDTELMEKLYRDA